MSDDGEDRTIPDEERGSIVHRQWLRQMRSLAEQFALKNFPIHAEGVSIGCGSDSSRWTKSAVPRVGGWCPIETAPKDGSRIICCGMKGQYGPDRDWAILCWKTNDRIVDRHKEPCCDAEDAALLESYFGDPWEWDDYDLALPGNGPTHWHPLSPLPEKP